MTPADLTPQGTEWQDGPPDREDWWWVLSPDEDHAIVVDTRVRLHAVYWRRVWGAGWRCAPVVDVAAEYERGRREEVEAIAAFVAADAEALAPGPVANHTRWLAGIIRARIPVSPAEAPAPSEPATVALRRVAEAARVVIDAPGDWSARESLAKSLAGLGAAEQDADEAARALAEQDADEAVRALAEYGAPDDSLSARAHSAAGAALLYRNRAAELQRRLDAATERAEAAERDLAFAEARERGCGDAAVELRNEVDSLRRWAREARQEALAEAAGVADAVAEPRPPVPPRPPAATEYGRGYLDGTVDTAGGIAHGIRSILAEAGGDVETDR